jgi:voltage-gated potassium channel
MVTLGTTASQSRVRALREWEAWSRIPMAVLGLIWLALVIVELASGESGLLEFFGTAIWIIFIAEFLLRFTLAPERLVFVRRNWITVVALVVPAFRVFAGIRVLRAVRALRSLRLVTIIGAANRGMNALRRTMRRRGLGYALALTVGVTLLGAAGMLAFEPASSTTPGLANFGDALWWTAMLITTMGTDFWPRTPEGRVLCLLLAVYGFAIFGYITASFASFFIGQDARSSAGEVAGAKQLARIEKELQRLNAVLRGGPDQRNKAL